MIVETIFDHFITFFFLGWISVIHMQMFVFICFWISLVQSQELAGQMDIIKMWNNVIMKKKINKMQI